MDGGLRGLEAVLAVARRGSFRAAPLDLGLSTTALSHTVVQLEAPLGVRLFNRTMRSVALSDAGRAFVGCITLAVAEIGDAMKAAHAQRVTPAGLLRINASVQAGRLIAPLVLALLRFPDMRMDLVTEERLVDIVVEGFDLGLRPTDLVLRDMIALPVGAAQRFPVVASPDWIATHGTPGGLLTCICMAASAWACRMAPCCTGPSSGPEMWCRSKPRAD